MPNLTANRLFSIGSRAAHPLVTGVLAALVSLGCSAKLEADGLAADPAPNRSIADADAPAPLAAPKTELPTATAPPAATADAGAADHGGADGADPNSENGARELRCGQPPYQPLALSARDIMAALAKGEPAGVEVTFKHCPGQIFPLGPGGATVLVSAGAETWVRFDAPSYLPWVEGEFVVTASADPLAIEATMVPRAIATSVVPAFKTEMPLVYVEVRKGRSVGPEACRSPAGVTLTVKGHPEAIVLYRDKGANAGYGTSLFTSEEGVAVIAGVPAVVGSIEIFANKTGCTYQPSYGDANSPTLLPILRAPLFSGALTHQTINPER